MVMQLPYDPEGRSVTKNIKSLADHAEQEARVRQRMKLMMTVEPEQLF